MSGSPPPDTMNRIYSSLWEFEGANDSIPHPPQIWGWHVSSIVEHNHGLSWMASRYISNHITVGLDWAQDTTLDSRDCNGGGVGSRLMTLRPLMLHNQAVGVNTYITPRELTGGIKVHRGGSGDVGEAKEGMEQYDKHSDYSIAISHSNGDSDDLLKDGSCYRE